MSSAAVGLGWLAVYVAAVGIPTLFEGSPGAALAVGGLVASGR
ncbi:MAG: hypothetical protein R3F59_10320 [Myxococcota bacterium]